MVERNVAGLVVAHNRPKRKWRRGRARRQLAGSWSEVRRMTTLCARRTSSSWAAYGVSTAASSCVDVSDDGAPWPTACSAERGTVASRLESISAQLMYRLEIPH
jgi:hypothetical protein